MKPPTLVLLCLILTTAGCVAAPAAAPVMPCDAHAPGHYFARFAGAGDMEEAQLTAQSLIDHGWKNATVDGYDASVRADCPTSTTPTTHYTAIDESPNGSASEELTMILLGCLILTIPGFVGCMLIKTLIASRKK